MSTDAYCIAVDVGGTFTDVVMRDHAGALTVGKGLSDHRRIVSGILEGLEVIAASRDTTTDEILASAGLFIYSTTRATNAILEGTTARTALLVTEGFPDILVLREGGRFNAFDSTVSYPDPYVARRLTFEVRERIDSEGQVVIPLDEAQTRSVLRGLPAREVEAVAVCLLWSINEPGHERAIGRLIEEELPGMPYTLSHALNPVVREYRRASATAIDASLKPLMQSHLAELERDLRDAGFSGEIFGAASAGGVMHLEDLAARPINTVKSGPSLAPVAARHYAEVEDLGRDIIACDTGGTSFDVSLVRDGAVKFSRETWLGGRFVGHMTGLSSVDVRSIGAGGGSLAWVDPGGLLRVGPQSAGADPGPACYGRGGEQPTVTDAALVLGYLDPEFFLGGRMVLDEAAARHAIGALAERFEQSHEDIAVAILTIAGEAMVQAIQELTINEGIDPRESLLVAGGGAAGLNIIPIARELGCQEVLIPRSAGALSACGAHFSDVVAEFSASRLAYTDAFAYGDVDESIGNLRQAIDEFAGRLRHRGISRFETRYFVEARYPSQVWELEIPLAGDGLRRQEDVAAVVADFHEAHKRVFGVNEPDAPLECLNWKGRIAGVLEKPKALSSAGRNGSSGHATTQRTMYFAQTGAVEAPVHRGEDLEPGSRVTGPAVVAEPTSTIVVYPDSAAEMLPGGNYLLSNR